jgi:uncharacterized damage-inducible protein DinB
MTTLAHDNIRYLDQALELLAQLDDETYRRPYPPMFNSGIGAHLRHVLDHYRSFLDGIASRRIDYDARARDPRIESDCDHAASIVREIVAGLAAVPDAGTSLLVKMDSDERAEPVADWQRSSVGRELQFLVSHTVHHYALIAVLLRLHGIAPEEEFGCAPSTLRYQRDQSLCAPQPG